jgi:hypothetical protein
MICWKASQATLMDAFQRREMFYETLKKKAEEANGICGGLKTIYCCYNSI